MFYCWRICLLLGTFCDLYSEVSCEENGLAVLNGTDVLIPEETEYEQEIFTTSGLSVAAHRKINVLAKDISHSKSAYRERIEQAGGEKEVRRSIVRKAEVSFESYAMRDLLHVFNNLTIELQLIVLEQIEIFVHKYEVAVNFADMGGLKIIAPLLFSSNDSIVSSVALVLGAAMQSNPDIQKLAKDQDIGNNLLKLLAHNSTIVVHHIIFALSTFLRNAPEAQEKFIAVSGVSKLTNILENPNIGTKTKLKIVTLFNDLAAEQQEATEHYQERRDALRRSFANEIIKCNICEHVISFLNVDDYDILEKTVAAMLSLDVFCHQDFTSVKDRVKQLLIIYDPLFDAKDPLHPQLDEDLRSTFHNELKDLLRKIEENADERKQHSLKDEL